MRGGNKKNDVKTLVLNNFAFERAGPADVRWRWSISRVRAARFLSVCCCRATRPVRLPGLSARPVRSGWRVAKAPFSAQAARLPVRAGCPVHPNALSRVSHAFVTRTRVQPTNTSRHLNASLLRCDDHDTDDGERGYISALSGGRV